MSGSTDFFYVTFSVEIPVLEKIRTDVFGRKMILVVRRLILNAEAFPGKDIESSY